MSRKKPNVQQENEISKINLWISADGHSIVDDKGGEVARFRDDIIIKTPKSSRIRLNGHMECHWDCMAWQGETCVKWVKTCTWVFDPL